MAIDSLRDFEIAFKDINLEKIGLGLTINAVASIMLAMYQAVAEKYGFDPKRISATPQNDILRCCRDPLRIKAIFSATA